MDHTVFSSNPLEVIDHTDELDDFDSDEAVTPTHRLQPPSQKDWARIQPIFTDLYIRQGKSLKDVQHLLVRDHAFRATTKMYKNRIKSWQLKKYVKASEKEKIATFIRDNDIKGDTLRKLKFNGRPARLDLVRRYCKKTGAHEEIANALPTKALEEQLTRIGDRLTKDEPASQLRLMATPEPPRRRRGSGSSAPTDITPTRSSASDPADSVTWHVQQYFEWHLASVSAESLKNEPATILANMASFSTIQTVESALKVGSFFEKILLGLDKFTEQHSAQGWELIHQACDEANSLITDQHRSLLRLLTIGFTDDRWSSLPGLRVDILRFLASMSTLVLGEDHDLSCILFLLQSEDVLQSAAEPILRAMCDILARHRGFLDTETCDARWSLADLLRNRGDFDGAARIGNEILLASSQHLGSHHGSTLTAIRRLADIHLEHGRPALARIGYREVLKRSTTRMTPEGMSETAVVFNEATVFSLQALCEVDRARADFKAKGVPFEHILGTVLTDLGSSQAQIATFISTWCEPLRLRQRWLGSNRYSDRLLARWALTRS